MEIEHLTRRSLLKNAALATTALADEIEGFMRG